jgi:hypothetical protein
VIPAKVELGEIVCLVQRILKIGVSAHGFKRDGFVDLRALRAHRPGNLAVETVHPLLAVGHRDFRKPLEWFGVRNEGCFTLDAASFKFAVPGYGLYHSDRVHASQRILVPFENRLGGFEFRALRPAKQSARASQNDQVHHAHGGLDGVSSKMLPREMVNIGKNSSFEAHLRQPHGW